MKHPHRYCEPYPGNPRIPRAKSNGRTKIELGLEDAHRLADIIQDVCTKVPMPVYVKMGAPVHQLINVLIIKLKNAKREVNHE